MDPTEDRKTNKYSILRRGEDSFGPIILTGGPCTNCGKRSICAHYHTKPKLPAGIDPNDRKLILNNYGYGKYVVTWKDSYLGVACGCYAKFHRQIAHIEDRMKR